MSNPSLAEEQLLELLLHLKRTTPDAARKILNSQAQISYALITLMVNLNAINFDVFQKILAAYGPSAASSSIAPAPSALPQHMQYPQSQYRMSTPPVVAHTPTPPYPNGGPVAYAPSANFGYAAGPPAPPPLNYPPAPAPVIPDALAAFPDEQKAMILRVIEMTPEQINQLAPTERASIIQLRTTLGIRAP